jgi:hypothetical protein
MIPKSGYQFPACAKLFLAICLAICPSFDVSAGEGRSEKIMLKQKLKRNGDST